jgi:hypothetical protein
MQQEFLELWDYLERKPAGPPTGTDPETEERPSGPAAGDAADEDPRVHLKRRDGRVRVIEVRCTCGREFDIECLYPDETPEEAGESGS